MVPIEIIVHSACFALASKLFDPNECIYNVEEKGKPHRVSGYHIRNRLVDPTINV